MEATCWHLGRAGNLGLLEGPVETVTRLPEGLGEEAQSCLLLRSDHLAAYWAMVNPDLEVLLEEKYLVEHPAWL